MKHKGRTIGIVITVVSVALIFFIYGTPSRVQTISEASFGGVSLRIEYATTEKAREKGLGGRASIPENYGMLFVFPKPNYYGFWMKNTLVPLDMFWLDNKGHVVYIEQDVATSSFPNGFYPSMPALYVLETAAGFAQAHDIAIGTPLLLKNFPSVSQ